MRPITFRTKYRVEVWYAGENPQGTQPHEGFIATRIDREAYGLYIADGDYEAVIPWHAIARVIVTEVAA